MGAFINTGKTLMSEGRASKIYVDKSLLIAYTNSVIGTESKFMCFSRPRRFGKSMAANMLAAYYDESCDSKELFSGLKIEKDPSFEKGLNKYLTLKLDMAILLLKTNAKENDGFSVDLEHMVSSDICSSSPELKECMCPSLDDTLMKVHLKTGKQFVVIIDEYDAIFREYKSNTKAQENYVALLRRLFKNDSVRPAIALAYMTGILPIKRYNTQSALNNFREFTMLRPGPLAPFVGFTEEEVEDLCKSHNMDAKELKCWYDGYSFGDSLSIYSPYSVVNAIDYGKCGNYWTDTSTANDALDYINMNFDGLKDDVVKMIAGERLSVNTRGFANDFVTLHNKNQVMTLLIHLGYLAYDEEEEEAYVPNEEVRDRLVRSIKEDDWGYISTAYQNSKKLLKATLEGNEQQVADLIEDMHRTISSIFTYNRESDLAMVIMSAYVAANEKYRIQREASAGNGYADVVFIPKRGVDALPMIVELKWDESAKTAIEQIKAKKYPSLFKDYREVLICGIAYSTKDKVHTARIERVKI